MDHLKSFLFMLSVAPALFILWFLYLLIGEDPYADWR